MGRVHSGLKNAASVLLGGAASLLDLHGDGSIGQRQDVRETLGFLGRFPCHNGQPFGVALAAEHLVPGSPVAGKGYFISDNDPQNLYLWFKPLCEGLGYKFPRMSLPVWLLNLQNRAR